MVTTVLGITAAVLAIATGYFAYKTSKVNDQFLDQKVKFESVIAYSKTLEEQLKTTSTAKITKAPKTDKVTPKAGKVDAPKKRGRKPSAK